MESFGPDQCERNHRDVPAGSRAHTREKLIISFTVVLILLTIYLKCYSMVNVNLGLGYSENILGFGGN